MSGVSLSLKFFVENFVCADQPMVIRDYYGQTPIAEFKDGEEFMAFCREDPKNNAFVYFPVEFCFAKEGKLYIEVDL